MLKNFIKLLIILIISMLIGNMAYGIYKEAKIGNGPNEDISQGLNQSNNVTNTQIDNNLTKNNTQKEEIVKEYEGYKVSAKLEIPKINLETYVLDSSQEDAMWLCPTKYFGPNPNEEGNYCIAAHNYNKDNMFNHIIELQKGDNIYLVDNIYGKVKYEIYDIYKVKPTETQVLSQKTEGKKEITLITCSDYSSKRIIVKAKAI